MYTLSSVQKTKYLSIYTHYKTLHVQCVNLQAIGGCNMKGNLRLLDLIITNCTRVNLNIITQQGVVLTHMKPKKTRCIHYIMCVIIILCRHQVLLASHTYRIHYKGYCSISSWSECCLDKQHFANCWLLPEFLTQLHLPVIPCHNNIGTEPDKADYTLD